MVNKKLIKIAKILSSNGIKGFVQVKILLDFNLSDLVNKHIFVKKDSIYKVLELEEVKINNQKTLFKFKYLNSINDIISLKGLNLFASESSLIINSANKTNFLEFKVKFHNKWWKITEQLETPKYPIIRMKNGTEEILTPLVDEYVSKIDYINYEITLKKSYLDEKN